MTERKPTKKTQESKPTFIAEEVRKFSLQAIPQDKIPPTPAPKRPGKIDQL